MKISLPKIAKVESSVYRTPIETPVRTSFGVMRDRPAVLVRVEDVDGAVGWGEAWCNFPSNGAEYRARLINAVLAPILVGHTWDHPAHAFRHLTDRLKILALQAGEPGPVAQAIAGIDIALWDLAGRRAGLPLWRLLGGDHGDAVAVYASGLNPDPEQAVALASVRYAEGYRAFKLKVGFGRERDLGNLRTLREALGPDTILMVDANQAWDREQAIAMSQVMDRFALEWLEEPIPADSPLESWTQLAAQSPVPLAGGENLRDEAFDRMIASGVLQVIQPDIAKWGGFSGCFPLARKIIAAGRRYCPHCLGGGISLIASAHLLAAAGGDGFLEVDANPNPLRAGLAVPFPHPQNGYMKVPDTPGLGVDPDVEALRGYQVENLL